MNTPDNPALLILDLDETLIHATSTPLEREADFSVFNYSIYIRPHLNYFLHLVKSHYQLAVWSSASDDYVAEVVKRIFPPEIPLAFVWGNSRCTPYSPHLQEDSFYANGFGQYQYAKKLNKLRKRGWNLDRVLIVDDTPAKVKFNYGNAIYVTEWTGQSDDKELYYLGPYLVSISKSPKMRNFEKRYWKETLINQSADFLDQLFSMDTKENTGLE